MRNDLLRVAASPQRARGTGSSCLERRHGNRSGADGPRHGSGRSRCSPWSSSASPSDSTARRSIDHALGVVMRGRCHARVLSRKGSVMRGLLRAGLAGGARHPDVAALSSDARTRDPVAHPRDACWRTGIGGRSGASRFLFISGQDQAACDRVPCFRYRLHERRNASP